MICALIAGFAIVLLRSDLTPWRVVFMTREEYAGYTLPTPPPRVAAAPAPTPDHTSWMFDPNYRTSFEKTTVIGSPERGKSRDASFATPPPPPVSRR